MLEERGLWHNGLRLKCKTVADCDLKELGGCCACTLMSLQEDFKSQKSRIKEVILRFFTLHNTLRQDDYYVHFARRNYSLIRYTS